MAGKLPFMRFVPADWMADPLVRGLSLPCRGAWIDWLSAIHQLAPDTGEVSKPIAWYAGVIGTTGPTARRLLLELRDLGTADIGDVDVPIAATILMRSRRMVREAERRSGSRERLKRFRNANETRVKRDSNAKATAKRLQRLQRNSHPSTDSNSSPSVASLPTGPQSPAGDSAPVAAEAKRGEPPRSGPAREVFGHYVARHPKTAWTPKRERLIQARLKEGRSVEELKQAIDGFHLDPWHCGENPDHKVWLGIELILRDASKVEAGLAFHEVGGNAAPTKPRAFVTTASGERREVLTDERGVPIRDYATGEMTYLDGKGP